VAAVVSFRQGKHIGAGLFKLFIVYAVVPRILTAFVVCIPVVLNVGHLC